MRLLTTSIMLELQPLVESIKETLIGIMPAGIEDVVVCDYDYETGNMTEIKLIIKRINFTKKEDTTQNQPSYKFQETLSTIDIKPKRKEKKE